jgi:VWFA-related protein
MRRRPAVVVSLACAGVLGVSVFAQDSRVRSRAEQVRVEVRVTDNRQNPVTDLQASDFEIMDDDQRQAIVTFIPPGRVQASTTAAPAGAPAAVSQESAAPAAAGRPVVVVLDDLHVGAPNTLKVTDAVRRFIETVVSSADSVAVVVTSGAGGGQDFTADRRLVLKAVDRFRGQKLRSATVERMNDPKLNLRGVIQPNADGNKPERANRARIALETLQKIGDALAPFEERRPMVLWVSEGPEYEVTDRPEANESNQWSISRGLRAAIERLNRVNAVMYAIDPRGVSAGNADQIQTSTIFEMYRSIGTSALRNEEVRAFGVVQTVAANTGGFAMLWRPNMSADFRRVVVANQSYYLIGYDAPAANRGKYHAIAVRVQRKGVQVRARSGYVLPAVP